MHIPDGWLSPPIYLVTWAITLIALGLALSKFNRDDLDRLSNIGAIASVIFVAQMFNFPVPGGTSGHLLGSALSVYVVGLPGTILTMFTIFLVQAIIFADGGILSLGANTLNMGIVGAMVAWSFISLFHRYKHFENKRWYYVGVFIASFTAVVVASTFAALELSFSGTTTLAVSLPLILGWHVVIGIGEGILTVFIISYLHRVEFLLSEEQSQESISETFSQSHKPIIGLGILLLILSALAIIASSNPDGLERVGQDLGFTDGSSFNLGLAKDYMLFGLPGILGTILSALLGIIILLGLFVLPSLYIKSKKMAVTA